MEEAKQTNFRVTPEAADKFRDYCKENGFNQAQGLAHIMQIIELNKAKDQPGSIEKLRLKSLSVI